MDNQIDWKIVNTFPGYEISNTGRIRSCDRHVFHPRFENKIQFVKGRELKKQMDKDGYVTVGLHYNGKLKVCKLHRLVAETFIDNPNNFPMINHLNSIRHDNRVENLEWCNNSMNQKHAFSTGYRDTYGEKNTHNKLKELDVWKIVSRVINGESQRKVSLEYGLSPGMVNNIMRGKAWPKTLEKIVPELIKISIVMLEDENKSFPCHENARVIINLENALMWLETRKKNREKRGVEGLNKA